MCVGTSVLASYKGILGVERAKLPKTKNVEKNTQRENYRLTFEQENGRGGFSMLFWTSVLASYQGISAVEKGMAPRRSKEAVARGDVR
jgi:hypothetical protein